MIERFETRRQAACFLAVALSSVAVAAVSAASVAARVGHRSPGFFVWSNLVVPAVSSERAAAGIPYRSVLLRVDGRRVRSAAELRERLARQGVGSMHRYEFRRRGERIRLLLPTGEVRWSDALPVFAPYLLVGSSFLLMGLAVFYFRPGLAAARAALALGATLGGTLVLAIDTLSSAWLERPYFLIEALVPGALLHFTLCFPEEKEILRRHPSLEWLVYLPFLPLGLAENVLLRADPERHLAVNDAVYTAIALTGLVAVASLVHTYFTSRSPLVRQRAKVVAAGVVAAAFLPSLGLLGVIVLGARLPINLLSPFFFLFPASVAYAIGRHDLFEVDRYLRLGAVYGALTVLVFVGYAGVVVATERAIGVEGEIPSAVVPLYLLLVLLVFQPARTRIQQLVDRLFHRQAYSYQATVERTSRLLASMLETDRVAATLLATVTDVMAIEWGVLFVLGEDPAERRVYARPPSVGERAAALFPPGDETLARIAAARRLLSCYEVSAGGTERHPAGFDFRPVREIGAVLLLPLRFEEKPVGVLLLGAKRSGAFYTGDDLGLLETLAHQSALALENARAYELLERTRDELIRSERLAAVGQLSAAVAHGIRNPLAGIRAAAQVAREDLGDSDGALAESLDDILAETDRLEARVRTVLDLSRPFEARPARRDLNGFLRNVAAAFRRRLPPGVELSVDLDPLLGEVEFDAAHLGEALDVLLVNASQALGSRTPAERRGRIRLATRLEGEGRSPTAVISVADDGGGMSAEQIGRAFDLFFTTKPGGTGIGLPVAKRFVEAQGGQIRVASEVGEGTSFEIRLPVAGGLRGARSA